MSPYRPNTRPLGYAMFLSRWLQVPLYLGLIVAQLVYVWHFLVELWHLVDHVAANEIGETEIMLAVLGLVDVVMIANLLIMVIVGGYETFVSRIDLDGHPDQPEWLSHVNANVLKVKLATAIVGISSIHLLKTFIEAGDKTNDELFWQTTIHLAFVVSAIALAWIDRLMPTHPRPDRAPGPGSNGGPGGGAAAASNGARAGGSADDEPVAVH